MEKIVLVSLLQPMTLNLGGGNRIAYKPGRVQMPLSHARALRLMHRIRGEVQSTEPQPAGQPVPVDPMAVPVEQVFDEQTVGILRGSGYHTIADIAQLREDELRSIPGIGPARYEAIQAALGRREIEIDELEE